MAALPILRIRRCATVTLAETVEIYVLALMHVTCLLTLVMVV